MEGDTSEGYFASKLAREIEGSVPEERDGPIRAAFLTSKLFKQIYDTLQPDTVSRARIRQVVITSNVHPDSADKCVACFVDGAIYAGLGSLDGENIALTSAGTTAPTAPAEDSDDVEDAEELVEETRQEDEAQAGSLAARDVGLQQRLKNTERPVADVRVNLAVDSSSDPDKLEKQLKLLKQYGLLH